MDLTHLQDQVAQNNTFLSENCYGSQQLIANLSIFSCACLILPGDWNVVLNDTFDKDRVPSHEIKNLKEKGKSYMNFFNLRDDFLVILTRQKLVYTFKPSFTQ